VHRFRPRLGRRFCAPVAIWWWHVMRAGNRIKTIQSHLHQLRFVHHNAQARPDTFDHRFRKHHHL